VGIDTIHDGISHEKRLLKARILGISGKKSAVGRGVHAPFSAKAGLKKSPSIA
jgi:hypothetical protein